MKIISMAIQKGGLGKTSGTFALSQYYAFVKNMKTLIFDMDPQANLTISFFREKGLSLKNVIMDRTKTLQDIITPTNVMNLDIVPANIEMEELEASLIAKADGPYKLRDLINDNRDLLQRYDLVFLDTPPRLGRLTFSSLVASDYVLIPITSKYYSADGLNAIFETIESIRKDFNPKLKVIGIYLNMFNDRPMLSQKIISTFRSTIPEFILNATVRQSIAIEEALSQQKNLYTYDAKSTGARDFAALGEEIIERLIRDGNLMSVPV